jgi:vitamin B12/bleomycin/antimicrobial peptide transport system ATP-binding/permease protein
VKAHREHQPHHHQRDFDRRLWRRFWRTAKLYWAGDEKWKAGGLLLILVLLLVGRTELTVLFNDQSGELTSALAARDSERFWHAMRVFGAALAVGVPVYAFYYYTRDSLGVGWRRWLTHRFLHDYLAQRAYYRLTYEKQIDNPDQRIADDINAFTQKSLKFLVEIIGALLQLLAFSAVLWSISRTLVGILVGYAALGSFVTFGFFGKPLIEVNFLQLRKEANFRFSLIRLRENAEAIAFYRGEEAESAQVRHRFGRLYKNYRALLRRTLGLNGFQYAYTFTTYVLPSIIVAPRILSGELEVGRAVQAAGAFASMLSALTIFIDNFELLSSFAAGVDRLHGFERALHAEHKSVSQPGNARIQHTPSEELRLENVTLMTPDHARVLIRDVSLSVRGQGLIVTGPSGCGKSSLLRAVAGLWDSGEGSIARPALTQLMFLPQRPYMLLGSLREQLLYPDTSREVSEEELLAALARVNLPNVAENAGGFEHERDFAKLLSVGEQQRLAVARVILSRPRFVVLDEATSALDAKNEQAMYELLLSTKATLLSVAHRPELLRYHSQQLEFVGDGSWHLRSLTPGAEP